MDIRIEKKNFIVRYKYPLIGGAVFLIILIYLLVTSGGASKLRYDKDNIQIAEVRHDKFIEYLEVEGLAQPKLTIKLNSLESGTVRRIVTEDGSSLDEGDTILILDNIDLTRNIGDEYDDLQKQRASYKEKKLQMERKTSELKRTALRTIYELDRYSKQYELDKEEYKIGIKSKAQLSVATDEYNFNRKNSQLLLDELRHDSLMNIIQTDLMDNDLVREEKRYARSHERLRDLVICAPISGQLSFLNVIPGERVAAGSNIGEMKSIEELKITVSVSEFYIDRVSVGLPAYIQSQGSRYFLKISKINPEIKERLFKVDLVFTDKIPDNIRIGKSYRVQVELGQPEDALVVDKGNFYTTTGGQWVFKVDKEGDKAYKTDIVIGRQNPRQYEVLEGLEDGDKIVITGYENFMDVKELILK